MLLLAFSNLILFIVTQCGVGIEGEYIVANHLSCRNPQYWINKGYSVNDAKFMAKTRMPGTYEYFKHFKQYSDDESNRLVIEWKSNRAQTLNNMVAKYGEIEGKNRWEQYRNKQAISNTFEYKREKYGWTLEQFIEYNNKRSVTLENLISRHGVEVGNIKWKNYKDRQAFAGCKLEYFIEKYGEIQGLEKYTELCNQKSHSLESYINRFNGDPEIGTKNYIKFWTRHRVPHSNIANELFDALFESLRGAGYYKIFYQKNVGEWYIRDVNKSKMYFLDFFAKELRCGIEFNGDYWHANPNKYHANDVISFPNRTVKAAKDIWDEDAYKLQIMKRHPDIDDILVVWEADFRNDKENTIRKCLNFLYQQTTK